VGLAQTAQLSGTPLDVAAIVAEGEGREEEEEEEEEEDDDEDEDEDEDADEWKLVSTTKYLEAAVRRM